LWSVTAGGITCLGRRARWFQGLSIIILRRGIMPSIKKIVIAIVVIFVLLTVLEVMGIIDYCPAI
jgi:hypothetical protein